MKEIIILVIMSYPQYQYPDFVKITHQDGRPLIFNNYEDCSDYIDRNFEKLQKFARLAEPKANDAYMMTCVEKRYHK